ncbi:hypothetical protein [Hymenobacter volaticus]|uniref:Glycosyltransferase RgtA/B/C/D-like domain-containing protein n=1 Tax=Hymenobacter volaticus TaxID=2932254 RepID=A0ABY4G3C8_9BACT|nr:hypothetical protein [Hymenobacter volaticus]UOQ65276.1 hypothetical protein MUN86_17215 [Hymenobacter volaticus]
MALRSSISSSAPRAALLPALALLAVTAIRLYGLSEVSLPDYDSVRNWQIVQEVAHGNLRNLFHHGSPAFSLVLAPIAWFTSDYRVYQHLNALLGVAALAWLVQFVERKLRLTALEAALLLLFTGTSVFLTFSGRDFTMGSMSLLVFVGLLRTHYLRLQQPSVRLLMQTTGWLALGLSVNYKFLLTLPILGMLELLYSQGLLWKPAMLARVLLRLLAPYIVLGLLGMVGGLPWYRWPAVYYNLVFPGLPMPLVGLGTCASTGYTTCATSGTSSRRCCCWAWLLECCSQYGAGYNICLGGSFLLICPHTWEYGRGVF